MKSIGFLFLSVAVWLMAGCQSLTGPSEPPSEEELIWQSRTKQVDASALAELKEDMVFGQEQLALHPRFYEKNKDKIDSGIAETEAFIAEYQPGDELWRFDRSINETYTENGLILVRDGSVLDILVTGGVHICPIELDSGKKSEDSMPDIVRQKMFTDYE